MVNRFRWCVDDLIIENAINEDEIWRMAKDMADDHLRTDNKRRVSEYTCTKTRGWSHFTEDGEPVECWWFDLTADLEDL